MKSILLPTVFIVTFCQLASGQLKTFSLSGMVTDSITKEHLQHASVILRRNGIGDTLNAKSAFSDKTGSFTFKNLDGGNYFLKVTSTGFLPFTKLISLNKNDTLFIELLKHTTTLSNVRVSSERKPVIHTSDKIVYNVSDGAITASDNLYNIILKLPGVYESNNTLYYQGKPVSILLDNKSNNLSGDDLKNYLSAMLGTNVDKLEILLNPSSKYDAQGGAVFNIKSQKNKNYGLTETITLGVGSGTFLRSTASITLNYRDSTINIYGGYDYNYQRQFFLLKAYLSFHTNSATVDFTDDNTRTLNNHAVRFGIDYDLNKKTSIGLLFKGFHNNRRRDVVNNTVYRPGNNSADTIIKELTEANATFKIPSLNLFLKTKLSSKGADLTLNADYFSYHKEWFEDYHTTYADKLGNSTASPKFFLNRSPADNSVKAVTIDFSHPIKNGNIETGVKATESKTDNNVLWQLLSSNSWKIDSAKTNHFIYKEYVYASYINVAKNYKKFSMQAGTRFEATRSNGISLTTAITTHNKYSDFFPSLSIQYKPSKEQQFSIAYRKSIRRFGFDIINPFVITQGPYSYHRGNPYIKPSYFNSVTISWSYKNQLVIGTGFSGVKNPMSYGYRKHENSNVSVGTSLNFSRGRLYNSNLSHTARLFKGKWTSINSISFLHSELPDFDGQMQNHNTFSLNTVNTVSLPKISIEVSAFYNSQVLDGTVLQGDNYGISVGLSKQVLKSKGSLKLSCVDLFNTQIFHNRTDGAGIKINAYWKPESRFANLLFTYRLGNLNVKANKNRKTGIEEERSRMGVN